MLSLIIIDIAIMIINCLKILRIFFRIYGSSLFSDFVLYFVIFYCFDSSVSNKSFADVCLSYTVLILVWTMSVFTFSLYGFFFLTLELCGWQNSNKKSRWYGQYVQKIFVELQYGNSIVNSSTFLKILIR